MQQAGAFIGTILGYAIGHILRIAGPQIEEMIANAIRRVFADTSEVSKPNTALRAAVERMRDKGNNHNAGN